MSDRRSRRISQQRSRRRASIKHVAPQQVRRPSIERVRQSSIGRRTPLQPVRRPSTDRRLNLQRQSQALSLPPPPPPPQQDTGEEKGDSDDDECRETVVVVPELPLEVSNVRLRQSSSRGGGGSSSSSSSSSSSGDRPQSLQIRWTRPGYEFRTRDRPAQLERKAELLLNQLRPLLPSDYARLLDETDLRAGPAALLLRVTDALHEDANAQLRRSFEEIVADNTRLREQVQPVSNVKVIEGDATQQLQVLEARNSELQRVLQTARDECRAEVDRRDSTIRKLEAQVEDQRMAILVDERDIRLNVRDDVKCTADLLAARSTIRTQTASIRSLEQKLKAQDIEHKTQLDLCVGSLDAEFQRCAQEAKDADERLRSQVRNLQTQLADAELKYERERTEADRASAKQIEAANARTEEALRDLIADVKATDERVSRIQGRNAQESLDLEELGDICQRNVESLGKTLTEVKNNYIESAAKTSKRLAEIDLLRVVCQHGLQEAKEAREICEKQRDSLNQEATAIRELANQHIREVEQEAQKNLDEAKAAFKLERDDLQSELVNCRTDYKKQSELDAKTAKVWEQLNARIKQLQSTLDDRTSQVNRLQHELKTQANIDTSTIEANKKTYSEQIRNLQLQIDAVESADKRLEAKTLEFQRQVDEEKRRCQRERDEATQRSARELEQQTTACVESSANITNKLKATETRLATANELVRLSSETSKEAQAFRDDLLGCRIIEGDLRRTIVNINASHTEQMVELQKRIDACSQLLTSREAKLQSELDAVAERNGQLQKQMEELNARVKRTDAAFRDSDRARVASELELTTAKATIADLRKTLEDLGKTLEAADTRCTGLLTEAKNDAEALYQRVETSEKQLASRQLAFEQKIRQETERAASLNDEVKVARNLSSSLQARVDELTAQLSSRDDTLAALRAEIEQKATTSAIQSEEARELGFAREDVKEAKRNLARSKEAEIKCSLARQELDEKLVAEIATHTALSDAIAAVQVTLDQCEFKRSTCDEKLRLSGLEVKRQTVEAKQLIAKHKEDIGEVVKATVELQEQNAAQAKVIAELRSKAVRSAGTIEKLREGATRNTSLLDELKQELTQASLKISNLTTSSNVCNTIVAEIKKLLITLGFRDPRSPDDVKVDDIVNLGENITENLFRVLRLPANATWSSLIARASELKTYQDVAGWMSLSNAKKFQNVMFDILQTLGFNVNNDDSKSREASVVLEKVTQLVTLNDGIRKALNMDQKIAPSSVVDKVEQLVVFRENVYIAVDDPKGASEFTDHDTTVFVGDLFIFRAHITQILGLDKKTPRETVIRYTQDLINLCGAPDVTRLIEWIRELYSVCQEAVTNNSLPFTGDVRSIKNATDVIFLLRSALALLRSRVSRDPKCSAFLT